MAGKAQRGQHTKPRKARRHVRGEGVKTRKAQRHVSTKAREPRNERNLAKSS